MSGSPARAPLLEAIDLRKSYGNRIAVDGLSFAISAGEVVGLLGPNGAGKTTTLSILASVLEPDSGRVLLHGGRAAADPGVARRLRGVVPQSLALYPTLTVRQNVWHFARMQGLTRAEARVECVRALRAVGLEERGNDAMQTLSGGMKRRLNLACGIAHRPALLLLDEVTVGVDLESRERIFSLVRHLRSEGAAVIYSTHTMEEAERVCDRILLIDRGKLVADGTVEELVSLAGARARMQLSVRGEVPVGWTTSLEGVRELADEGACRKLSLELAGHAQAGEVLERLRAAGVRVVDFSLHSPNLADAFLALTGRALREPAQG
jgi:ABC-2 type transport system ATP-binding protein